jgi:hypothetical protein
MRTSEALAVVYFLYLIVAALFASLPRSRRVAVGTAGALVIAAEIALARVQPAPAIEQLRNWFPALVILIAYFITGLFYLSPSPAVEAWLKRWDGRLIGGLNFERVPRPVRDYLELVYDACFLLIPAGYAVLAWTGRSAFADRYWTLVSAAEFLCFATLPWLPARPPWAIGPQRPSDHGAVRRFSLSWVSHTTIRANTFPSGHAAASFAVALAVWPHLPWAGVVFAGLATSIVVGSVIGRFHYAIDAIAGLFLALGLAAVTAVMGR